MDITFEELDSYLSSYTDTTSVSSPLALNITDTVADNWLDSANADTIGSVLLNYPSIYVDLSSTTIPEDAEEMDSTFENCKNLVKAPNIPEMVSNLSECFKNCTSLKTAPSIAEGVTTMYGTFYGCTALTVGPTIPSTVSTMQYCFYNCTSLVTPSNIPDGVNIISNCYRNCTSLTKAPTVGNSVTQMTSCFQGCTKLSSAPNLPDTVTIMTSAFNGCSALTTVGSLPSNLTKASSNIFAGCTSLYNAGIWSGTSAAKIKNLFGTSTDCNVRAIAILGDEAAATLFGKITSGSLKIYTTSDHYEALKASVAVNYPSSGYEVISVDACLDYDDISNWLSSQKENTTDTPYTLFVGGGLTSNVLQGQGFYYGSWNSSAFASLFYKHVYVDLINLCLSKDTSNLRSSFVPIKEFGSSVPSSTTISPYITRICEIPDQVNNISGTFCSNTVITGFGENNLIPSSVMFCSDPFSGASSLKDIYIEHQITTGNYAFSNDNCSYNIYAKDYSALYKSSKALCDNRRVILECDYADLDTYLSWFDMSCEDVNLKVNGLTAADVQSTSASSPFSAGELCKHLLGTYASDNNAKGYCASSTFDLRLTECPQDITQLNYAFYYGNLSYSFAIPEKVTSLIYTYYDNSLKEFPVLPENLVNMEGTFGVNVSENKIDPPTIPTNVRNMIRAFECCNLNYMPAIPQYVTDMSACFQSTTGFTTTSQIPNSVLLLNNCFEDSEIISIKNIPSQATEISGICQNTKIVTVPNIPSTVKDASFAFQDCSSLTDIYNWDLDVTKSDLDMNSVFTGCASLNTIHTTSKAGSSSDAEWRHVTVKPNNYNEYTITVRDLKGTTSTIKVTSTAITSAVTDELIFSPQGELSDSYITDMLSYRLPFGNGLDPSKKNFVVWAADSSAVKTNIVSSEDADITSLQKEVATLKAELAKSVKLSGTLAEGSTSLTITNAAIKADMMISVFTSEFGILPSEISLTDGSVTLQFDETHDNMTVGIKLEEF